MAYDEHEQSASALASADEARSLVSCIERYHTPFSALPFDDVDSLVLSSLSYLNYERYPLEDVESARPVPLIDILRFTPNEELTCGSWLKDGDDVPDFLRAVACSVRYRTLAACLYAHEAPQNIDKQFCAVTFVADDMPPYVAYRGTDGTVAGWREDFDLAYKDIIPSHTAALRYLSGVLSSLSDEPCVNVGGHSKGGNLAEYAAACIDEAGFSRIAAVYNHDGPAFLQAPSPRFDLEAYRSRCRKTIPESSIFGMILERRVDYRVVHSDAFTVFQHRPFNWLTSGHDFSYADELNDNARLFDDVLDSWLRSSTPEQRQIFLDTLFDLVKSTEASNWEEFQASFASNIPSLLRKQSDLDDETREVMASVMSRLVSQARSATVGYLSDRFSDFATRVKRGRER